MKKLFLLIALSSSLSAFAQNGTSTTTPATSALDKSPMDMAYYPVNYPVLKVQEKATEPLLARVIYSRPQKNNRVVFGNLIEYGEVWRMGANEATEIEFFRDVKIGGKKLLKGRYTMYAIPTEKDWTIIFNRDTDTWGAFRYDSKKDALRVSIPTQKSTTPSEAFSMEFKKSASGADLYIGWDDTFIMLPISR